MTSSLPSTAATQKPLSVEKVNWTGGDSCCVHGCKNMRGKDKKQGERRSYYSFPFNDELCEEWLSKMPQAKECGWEPSDSSRICSDHFEGGELSKK